MNSAKSGNKFNTQESDAFLYTNNDQSGKEINKIIPSIIASKIIKYFRIKDMNDIQ